MEPPYFTTLESKEQLKNALTKYDDIRAAVGAVLEIGQDVTEYLHERIAGHPEEAKILADTEVMYDTRTGSAMITMTITETRSLTPPTRNAELRQKE